MDYAQPQFYKFSEDSILLSQIIYDELEKTSKDQVQLLDVGCGCGVIGLEVMKRRKGGETDSLLLLEKQAEFMPFIKKNCSSFLPPEIDIKILNCDFLNFKTQDPLTHIVSNPPYFLTGQGRISPDPLRQKCRTWERVSALSFLEHLAKTCQAHRAQGFLCGRSELRELMEEIQLSYKILLRKNETSFFTLIV